MKQKLEVLQNKERDVNISKGTEIDVSKTALEEKLRATTSELIDKRAFSKHLEKQLKEAKLQNKTLESTIDNLRQVIQASQEQQVDLARSERTGAEMEEMHRMISVRDNKISKLKEKLNELEREKEDLERSVQGARRQLNGSIANSRDIHHTRVKNSSETSCILRLKIIKLQGEVAQKDLKIESLNQKVNYLKQKEVAARRVRENLNEFHKDLFGSFEMSRKR